jgi:hypothetical protein
MLSWQCSRAPTHDLLPQQHTVHNY